MREFFLNCRLKTICFKIENLNENEIKSSKLLYALKILLIKKTEVCAVKTGITHRHGKYNRSENLNTSAAFSIWFKEKKMYQAFWTIFEHTENDQPTWCWNCEPQSYHLKGQKRCDIRKDNAKLILQSQELDFYLPSWVFGGCFPPALLAGRGTTQWWRGRRCLWGIFPQNYYDFATSKMHPALVLHLCCAGDNTISGLEVGRGFIL